jgi:hypothetical protein
MQAIDLLMASPLNRIPFVLMIPEIAHPEGILTIPSRTVFTYFP